MSSSIYNESTCSTSSNPPLFVCGTGRNVPQPICDFEQVPDPNDNTILIATQVGSCIPSNSQIIRCLSSPSECVCPATFDTSPNPSFGRCGVPSATIDIYISNQSTSSDLRFVERSDAILSTSNNTVQRCWLTPPNQVIAPGSIGFSRSYVVDTDQDCDTTTRVTTNFDYDLFDISSSGSNSKLGTLSVSACRTRVATQSCGNGTCTIESLGSLSIGGYGPIGQGCIENQVILDPSSQSRFQVQTTRSGSQVYIVFRDNSQNPSDDTLNPGVIAGIAIAIAVVVIIIAFIFFVFLI